MIAFSETDREAIRKAVSAAEGETSGEIVPFVTVRSSRYAAAAWRFASLSAMLAAGVHLTWTNWLAGWGASWLHEPSALAAAALLTGLAAFVLARRVPAVTRLVAGEAAMTQAVHSRARNAFLDEEVFDTRDRTGILLYVSLLEHRIEVVGDSGINAQVSPDDWVEVVALIRDGIRGGQPADGLVAGIARCGDLLRDKGVAIKPDDTNELSDGLRFDAGA